MNPSGKNGTPPQKPDKVTRILTEARQVVDDLDRETAPPPSPRKKSPPAAKKAGPRSAAAKTARQSVPTPVRVAAAAPPVPLLSPREYGIKVLHALPGRVRFRIHSLLYDDDFARELEARLAAVGGITGVWASSATGSLLIYYQAAGLTAVSLGKALETWFPRLDTESLLAEMLA
jgi:hypothetical protein